MRLSKRIYSICNAVKQGETVADIGTDHGYVPMLLLKNNISPYAIMSDISSDSLSKAIQTFSICGIKCSSDQFRVGDGLNGIKPAEVDDIIIAGLGGLTIIEIIDNDITKTRSYKKLIIQPRKHSGNLRHYLYTHGFDIVAEELSSEGKFICETITAVPTFESSRAELYDVKDIRWQYPESFIYVDPILLKKRIEWKLGSIDEEISNLLLSKSNSSTAINILENNKQYLLSLLAKNNSYHEKT